MIKSLNLGTLERKSPDLAELGCFAEQYAWAKTLQMKFKNILDTCADKNEKADRLFQKSDDLFKSLTQQAFRGEL